MEIVGHVSGKEILKGRNALREVLSLGLGVELQITSDVLDRLTLKEFGKLKREIGEKTVTVHAPFIDLNPGALDGYVLKATKDRFFETITVSRVLDAKLIVFHTGYHPQKVKSFYKSWFERALSTFEEVLENWHGKIVLENVFDETPENLKNFMRELPKDVGVCLDIGHINLFSKVPISNWFEELGDRIYEFHLHDNCGSSDQHLPLGKGRIDIEGIFELINQLKTEYILNLENKTPQGVKESLEFLRRRALWREK